MSLESVVQENTVAILKLVETLMAAQKYADERTAAVMNVAEKVVKDAVEHDAKEEAKTTAKIKEEVKKEIEKEVEKAVVLTQDDARKIILTVAKKSRSEAEALLARFGAAGISKLKEEQWADVIDFGNAILAGEKSAITGEGHDD